MNITEQELQEKIDFLRENDVWERVVNTNKCALCDRWFFQTDKIYWESRHTGRDFKLQNWAYHMECFENGGLKKRGNSV